MNTYIGKDIRNVCLVAHSKAGKTSLAEAMLMNTGVLSRMGKIADGNTVCDYDSEEIKRGISIRAAVASAEWKGKKINIIDTPGYFDFVGDMISGLRVADTALVVINAKSGVEVGSENAFEMCSENKVPVCFFVNRVDEENVNFSNILAGMQAKFGSAVVPLQIPVKEGEKFIGYVDVLKRCAYQFDGKALVQIPVPADIASDIDNIKAGLAEAIAESDEALMEKFFADEPFTDEELAGGVRKAVAGRTLFPVFCGSATQNVNINTFMDVVVDYLPSPLDREAVIVKDKDENSKALTPEDSGALAAFVFKTISDPYVGKLSLFKVYSGVMKSNSAMLNSNREANEKIGPLLVLRGKEKSEVATLSAGDIGAVAKLTVTHTGDTLCAPASPVIFDGIAFPKPVYSMAIVPKARGDEDKIGVGLTKLSEEDYTFSYRNDAEIHQLIISGLGDQHLEVIVHKLKDMGTEVSLCEPKVTYRETITKKIQAEGKHKKQSGGHGQYGHVKMEFEPCEGDDLVFEEKIFGGSVPKNFHPAVEKGLREMMVEGIQAGYRAVGIKATLCDGSYHDVDSSEMSFKMAAHLAFKELVKANPILLEPIGRLQVNVPDEYTGDVMGDINKRRGRVLGMEPGMVVAEIPMSEMFKYAIDLRSMTHGRGKFAYSFERYEQAPPMVAQKVIEQHKKEKAE